MTAIARELRAIAAHLFDRIEEAASTPDPEILESIAAECEGAARVLRNLMPIEVREKAAANAIRVLASNVAARLGAEAMMPCHEDLVVLSYELEELPRIIQSIAGRLDPPPIEGFNARSPKK